jgi:hypothetical protein
MPALPTLTTFSPSTLISSSAVNANFAAIATQFSTGTTVYLNDVQTLTNKTLTSPVINTPTGIVKSDVGLGNVDNTSDVNKPTSTAQAASIAAATPITTKGDILVFSTTKARLGVGSNGQVLTANSGATEGVSWTTPASAPSSSNQVSNLSLACSVAASALTIALKDSSGSDPSAGSPVLIGMRSATAATGTYTQRSVTGALSVVISSGSTLGTASATEHNLYVYAIDNAGTVELAVSQNGFLDGEIISTTAEGGAGGADSNALIYSTTARSNVAARLIGRLRETQTTAGTWAAVPTQIYLAPIQPAVVNCKVANSTTSKATGGVGPIIYTTKTYDSHNAYNTSTGEFTVPVAGKYEVKFGVYTNAASSTSVNNSIQLYVRKNGTSTSYNNYFADSLVSRLFAGTHNDVDVYAVGDIITTNWGHNWGVTLTNAGTDPALFVTITKVD